MPQSAAPTGRALRAKRTVEIEGTGKLTGAPWSFMCFRRLPYHQRELS
jgi:hypothetical protein